MNKKMLVVVVALILSMAITPLVMAKPWTKDKTNEKFQSFSTTHTPNPIPILNSEKNYVPNEDNPNKIVQTWEESMINYEIFIGEKSFVLHEDFEYEGTSVFTAIGAPFNYIYGVYMGSTSNHWRIQYTYDFSAIPNGIEGKLEMLFIHINGETSIRSLKGTGDLANVQIMATAVLGMHEGIVLGWPTLE